MGSATQSSLVFCACVSVGNTPLSCAAPLADNGQVWGEHYHLFGVLQSPAVKGETKLLISRPRI